MQLLPMASSPDGLISARDAVITKTPGWGVLTTTSNVNITQGHGATGGGGDCGQGGSNPIAKNCGGNAKNCGPQIPPHPWDRPNEKMVGQVSYLPNFISSPHAAVQPGF